MTRFAFLAALALVATPAFADCPQGALVCSGDVNTYQYTTDAVASFDCSRFHVTAGGSFDHAHGLASTHSISMPGNNARAGIYDEFVLTGPAAGTVVPIVVVGDFEFENVRQVNAATHSSGEIFTPPITGAPNPNFVEVFFTASAPGTETSTQQIQLAMNVKAGQKFEIGFSARVYSAGNAGGSSHGRLSFAGLPPGSSVTSCKGFRQDQPVPALPTSWGTIKASYR